MFADESALLASTRSGAEHALVIVLDGGNIEAVEELPYLGSLITSSERMDMDVDRQIVLASRALGALCKAMFLDKNPRRDIFIMLVSCLCCCIMQNAQPH